MATLAYKTHPPSRLSALGLKALWISIALALHVGLAYGASNVPKVPKTPPKPEAELSYVKVDLPDPPKELKKPPEPEPEPEPKPDLVPEPEPLLAEAAPPEPEPKPNEKPKPKKEKKRAEKKDQKQAEEPQEAPPPEDPFADFAEFGANVGSTSGQGSISVSTGSRVDGALRSGGRREGTKDKPKVVKEADEGVQAFEAPVKVVSRKKLDRKAKPDTDYNRKIKAKYPPEMKEAGLEADVVALVTVKANGSVAKVEIVNDVNALFERAAIDAIKEFRFKPALKDSEPVASKVRLKYRFRLDEVS